YYSQFVVFRRIMLNPELAQRQPKPADGAIGEGLGRRMRRLSRHGGRGRGRRMSLSSERRNGRRQQRRLSHTSTDSARTRVSRSPSPMSSSGSEEEEPIGSRSQEKRISLGKTFAVMRVPLAIAVLAAIVVELAMYFLTRLLVRLYEACVMWRGRRGRLLSGLGAASSYEEYMEYARAIDAETGVEDEGSHFDTHILERLTRALRRARTRAEAQQGSDSSDSSGREMSGQQQRRSVQKLCDVLRQGAVRANAGGWEAPAAWRRMGGSALIDAYVAEVERSFWCVRQSHGLSAAEQLAVFGDVGQQQGRMALCLSGGAALGWKHLGVARSLLDEARLPRIISGTSAGALVAALLATHTDDELRRIVRPELAKYMTACQGPFAKGLRRWAKWGHYFDAVGWAARAQVFTRGNLTFAEAFARTGKILNISCTPLGRRHSAPRLLNYVTAPDVLVWSAVLASAALPGALPPMVLLMKTRDGRVRPYTEAGSLWRDGSFCSDIPYGPDLRRLNVQFTVVSQVNPHISMFFYERGGGGGSGGSVGRLPGTWRGGFVLSAIEHMLKLDIRKWLRLLCDLDLVPLWFNQDWSYVWLQKFDGNITILPSTRAMEWMGLLSDPSEKYLETCMRQGVVATWPKIAMIRTRQRVEDAIAEGWAEAYGKCYGASPLPTTLALRGKQQHGRMRKKSIAAVYHRMMPSAEGIWTM
ncbi:hypothetical protein GGI24_004368, partial [Coemansia furcata]